MSTGRDSLDAALRRVAAELAPDMISQIVDGARRDAAAIVQARLTTALVDSLERHIGGGERRPEPVKASTASGAGDARISGLYVYGITWASAARSLQIDDGVEGSAVEVVASESLAAVVSPVSADAPWGQGPDGEVDMEPLARRARQHESVLEQVLEQGAVLPLRFGVLFRSAGQLRELMAEKQVELEVALRRLDGSCEWGLTIGVERPETAEAGAVTPAEGRDYLVRRRDDRLAQEEAEATSRRAAAAIHAGLAGLATESVVHPARRPNRRKDSVVLRASYLVPRDRTGDFRSAAESGLLDAHPELGLVGELTGPWPPYHFCDVSLDGVPA